MKNLISFALLFLSVFYFANNPIIDISTAKQKAKSEHKLILLKFSGSDWCIPCIKLQKNVIDKEEFKKFSEQKLILLNADFPRQKKNQPSKEEVQINNQLAEKYNKDGVFPKMILMDENGKILETWVGNINLTSQQLMDKINKYSTTTK